MVLVKKKRGENAATEAIFSMQFMTSRRQHVCWAEKAAVSPFGSFTNVAEELTGFVRACSDPPTSAIMTGNPSLVLFNMSNVSEEVNRTVTY